MPYLRLIALLLLAGSTAFARELPTTVPAGPGHHRVRFTHDSPAGKLTFVYVISVPEGMEKSDPPRPMLVFLNGIGDRGREGHTVFNTGPAKDLRVNRQLFKDFPMVLMSPECLPDRRLEDAQMRDAILAAIDSVIPQMNIDPARIYLTGLSMGGQNTWRYALARPDLFAAIAPISAIAIEPDRAPSVLKDMGVWIICGDSDGNFTTGSMLMRDKLRAAGVDVSLTMIPSCGHDAWSPAYRSIDFYRWFLNYRKGHPPDPARKQGTDLDRIIFNRDSVPDLQKRVQRDLDEFTSGWTVSQVGDYRDPGLHDEFGGKRKVFVNHSLTQTIPAILSRSAVFAPNSNPRLFLTVGHHPEGDWRLIIKANGDTLHDEIIGPQSCKDLWKDIEIDLSAYAGKETKIELLNDCNGWHHEESYWARIKLKK